MWFKTKRQQAREAYAKAVRVYEDAKRRNDTRSLKAASEALTEAMHARMRAGA